MKLCLFPPVITDSVNRVSECKWQLTTDILNIFDKLVSKNISITLSSLTNLLVDPLAGVLEGH